MPRKKPKPVDVHVGACIRARRYELNVSQERLADALGLTFQQIQKYESGINRVGASRLQDIANTLKVPVSFFFEGAPSDTSAFSAVDTESRDALAFAQSSEGAALLGGAASIKRTGLRQSIVRLVEQLAGSEDKNR